MKLCSFLLLVLSLFGLKSFSQSDSVVYATEVRLEDGIYLTYQDFRQNKSVKKAQISSKLDKDQLEFLTKVIYEGKFLYTENGETINVESKNVWGYFQNNTFYVNYEGDFYRVPVFGSISYFVASITVVTPGFYDPRFGMTTGSSTRTVIKEFIMNYYDGVVREFTLKTAEELLARDTSLYEAYKKTGKRKQKEQMYGYIRKYNAAHPVYFLR